ncbi:TPA: hypothetical protein N0F65_008054, partial [Lagenidium giganteum]
SPNVRRGPTRSRDTRSGACSAVQAIARDDPPRTLHDPRRDSHMTLRRSCVLPVLAAAAVCAVVQASIYPVKSDLWVPPFQRAEKMFATDQGPIFARHGNSSITVDVHGVNLSASMDDWRMVVFFYHAQDYEVFETVSDKIELLACSQEAGLQFSGMNGVKRFMFPVKNESVHAVATYDVRTAGWTDTQIFVCSNGSGAAEAMDFEGTMEVRNPFGLLPAVLYGLLPFSALLAFGYTVFDVFFIVLLCRHRQQILQLHYGILLILILGTVTSSMWFYSFMDMNKTGAPVCCPYPTNFLIAVTLDTLMRTVARIILLIVCLGYGIVRDSLTSLEAFFVSVLSISYFLSGIGDEVSRGTSSGAEFRQKPTVWSFVQLLCNLMFIMWIHYSMERILRQLSDQKQCAKLGMYKSLAWALVAFIVFFTILTMVAVCSRLGVFEWGVEWEWMQLVAWPVLNFVVSAAMCLIWRPSPTSSQYAFSMQLPQHEGDDNGMELAPRGHSDDEMDVDSHDLESDEDEEVDVELSPPKDTMKKSSTATKAKTDE